MICLSAYLVETTGRNQGVQKTSMYLNFAIYNKGLAPLEVSGHDFFHRLAVTLEHMWHNPLLLTPILALVQQANARPLIEHGIEKRKATWGPTEYRHHEWQLPKQITCKAHDGKTVTYGVDNLELMSWGATQFWVGGNYDSCTGKVQCFQRKAPRHTYL